MSKDKCFIKHNGIFYFVFLLILILFSYFIFSCYVSFTLNKVIKKALNNEPYDNSLINMISEEEYRFLNPKQIELEEGINSKVVCSNTLPFVLPYLTDAHYTFSYMVTNTDTDKVVYGTSKGHVVLNLDFNIFSVYISEVVVAP